MLTVCLKNVKELILTVEEEDIIPVFGKEIGEKLLKEKPIKTNRPIGGQRKKEIGEKLLKEKPIKTNRPIGGQRKDDSVSLRNRIRKSFIANAMSIYYVLRTEFEVGEKLSVRKVVNTLVYKGFFSPKQDARWLSASVNKIVRECCARGLILRGDSKQDKAYKIAKHLPPTTEFFDASSIVYHLRSGSMAKIVQRSVE